MTRKRILVLGAGPYYVRTIQLIAEAGYTVLCCDRNPDAPGGACADFFHVLDFSDAEAVAEWAAGQNIDGVLALNDFGTRAAALTAERLGLPGITPASADRANDKGLMRDAWAAADLPQPDYRVVESLASAQAAAGEIGFPCIVKPADSGGGGRGVSIVADADQVEWAFEFAVPYALNGRVMVETFIDGVELTVETVTDASGQTHMLALSDKVKPPLRTRVATSLNYPAALTDAQRESVRDLAVRCTAALGIGIGMAHTEMILSADGLRLVETGARGGGGHVFHTLIEASSGINAPALAAALATGAAPNVPQPLERGACYRFFTPPSGILRAVCGLEQARIVPGVLDVGMLKKIGDRVGDLPNSLERAGFVATAGKDRDEAVAVADSVCSVVRFDVALEP